MFEVDFLFTKQQFSCHTQEPMHTLTESANVTNDVLCIQTTIFYHYFALMEYFYVVRRVCKLLFDESQLNCCPLNIILFKKGGIHVTLLVLRAISHITDEKLQKVHQSIIIILCIQLHDKE